VPRRAKIRTELANEFDDRILRPFFARVIRDSAHQMQIPRNSLKRCRNAIKC
jgi:hypothetical protein